MRKNIKQDDVSNRIDSREQRDSFYKMWGEIALKKQMKNSWCEVPRQSEELVRNKVGIVKKQKEGQCTWSAFEKAENGRR